MLFLIFLQLTNIKCTLQAEKEKTAEVLKFGVVFSLRKSMHGQKLPLTLKQEGLTGIIFLFTMHFSWANSRWIVCMAALAGGHTGTPAFARGLSLWQQPIDKWLLKTWQVTVASVCVSCRIKPPWIPSLLHPRGNAAHFTMLSLRVLLLSPRADRIWNPESRNHSKVHFLLIVQWKSPASAFPRFLSDLFISNMPCAQPLSPQTPTSTTKLLEASNNHGCLISWALATWDQRFQSLWHLWKGAQRHQGPRHLQPWTKTPTATAQIKRAISSSLLKVS